MLLETLSIISGSLATWISFYIFTNNWCHLPNFPVTLFSKSSLHIMDITSSLNILPVFVHLLLHKEVFPFQLSQVSSLTASGFHVTYSGASPTFCTVICAGWEQLLSSSTRRPTSCPGFQGRARLLAVPLPAWTRELLGARPQPQALLQLCSHPGG